MPRIEEYVPRVNPDFTAGAGNAPAELGGGLYQGLGSGLHDIGEALSRYGEQQETSKLHVAATNLQTQAFTDWENLKQNGDITDPEQVQQFNDDYSNKLQSLTDNITSPAVRNHANELLASVQGDLAKRTLADHAAAVGQQAQENYSQIINSYSSLASNDPTFYEEGSKQLDMMVAASGLPANKIPEAQLKARQELARSTIKGVAEGEDLDHINQMRVEIETGRFDQDLNEDQKTTAMRLLHQRETQVREDIKTQGLLEKQQKAEASKDAVTGYQQQLAQPGLNFTQWANQILKDPNVIPADRESIIRFGHFMIQEPILEKRAQEREDRAESRATNAQRSEGFWNAWAHVNSGDIDSPTQINDLATRHIIDLKDVNVLQGELARRKKAGPGGDADAPLSKNFYDNARGKLKDFATPEGDPFHDNFAAVWQLDQQERENGIPAAERYDPKSPKYVGKAFDEALSNALGPTTPDNAKPAPVKTPAIPRYENPDVMEKAYAHMPRGTVFIGPDGKPRRKP